MENWKEIAGYEGRYEVSDLGRVRRLGNDKTRKENILKPRNCCGYLRVQLCKKGKTKYMLIHRLVAEAFIPNPLNLKTVNHKDEDKTNNSVSNLEWMTLADNQNYGTRNLRIGLANVNNPKISKPVVQLDKNGNIIAAFPSTHEAERKTGIAQQNICNTCGGRLKSAGGYIWRYAV